MKRGYVILTYNLITTIYFMAEVFKLCVAAPKGVASCRSELRQSTGNQN